MNRGLLGVVGCAFFILMCASNVVTAQTPYACSAESSLKSITGTTPITVSFSNQTSGVVSKIWLNYTGQRIFYNTIAAGAVQTFNTFLTHPWIVLDAAGKCLGIYVFTGSGETAVITNPGGSQPTLQFSASSLSFSAKAGGAPPGSQSFLVSSQGAQPVSFAVGTDGGQPGSPAPPWLHVSPASGTTPGLITATVDPGVLAADMYSARIVITAAGASTQQPAYVPLMLTAEAGSPLLDVAPDSLSFAAHAQSSGILDQPLMVRNRGGGGPLGFTVTVVSGGPWLSVNVAAGQTASNTATLVHVQANTQGLKVGGYTGLIRLTAKSNTYDVPVELFVADNGSILGLDVSAVRFQSRQNNGTSIIQNVNVLNLGDAASTINWTAQVVQGSENLDLAATGGTATPLNSGALPLKPSAASIARPAGGYYALVKVSDPQALNSPQYITAVIDQADAATLPKPDPAPQGLVFVAAAGGAAPASQSVTLNVDSGVPIAFQASASTNGGTWLSVTPATGTTSGAVTTQPAQVSATVNQTGLTPGIYTGEIDISLANSLRAVNVTLIVTPAGTASTAPAQALATGSASCAPGKLALTETSLANNFSVPAGWPAALIVALHDDCGHRMPGGSVTASFSNGDPPLMLRGDPSGNYSTTWQPGVVAPQMEITFNAAAGGLQPATAQLIGGINQNQNAPPRLFKNGAVNVFNRVPAGAVAPGMIVEVYGAGLASAKGNPGVLPLPDSFQGTSMFVGAYELPLYFVSGGQLDVQIAAELTPNQQYPIIVSSNGALSIPDVIDVNAVQLGLAALADGHAIAQHGADSSSVDSTHPAKPGEVLVVYLSGMGPTNPSVKSGAPAPASEPLARVTIPPTVTVDGQNATVQFAGLAPGFAGLYQINFQVPSGAKSGDLSLTASQNGVSSNTATLPVKR